MSSFRIERREDIPTAIRQAEEAGFGHHVPLLRALYHGEIAFIQLPQAGAARLFKLWTATARRPSLVLIADDDDFVEQDGPQAWPIAPRALRWANHVVIHGAAGAPAHYQAAVDLAKAVGRVLLIECRSAQIEAWCAAVNAHTGSAVRATVLHPPPGVAHPCPRRRVFH